MESVTYAQPRDPSAWSRWAEAFGLTFSVSRLEKWQRRWVGIDTDRRSFAGIQVAGYHVGVYR